MLISIIILLGFSSDLVHSLLEGTEFLEMYLFSESLQLFKNVPNIIFVKISI